MKQLIKYLVGLIALVFYITPSRVVAQGFVEPTEHTRYYYPDEGHTNVTLFELIVYGNDAVYTGELAYLHRTFIELNPSAFSEKLYNVQMGIYYETIDSFYSYNGDIVFNDGVAVLNEAFSLYKPKYIQKFIVKGSINTFNLKDGDMLSVGVKLGIGKNGWPLTYYVPEPQYLIYKKRSTSGIKDGSTSFVNIYPNPFVDQINVDLPKEENVIITNSVGQNVYVGPSGQIDASSFPKDVYTISTSKGICKVVKLH